MFRSVFTLGIFCLNKSIPGVFVAIAQFICGVVINVFQTKTSKLFEKQFSVSIQMNSG